MSKITPERKIGNLDLDRLEIGRNFFDQPVFEFLQAFSQSSGLAATVVNKATTVYVEQAYLILMRKSDVAYGEFPPLLDDSKELAKALYEGSAITHGKSNLKMKKGQILDLCDHLIKAFNRDPGLLFYVFQNIQENGSYQSDGSPRNANNNLFLAQKYEIWKEKLPESRKRARLTGLSSLLSPLGFSEEPHAPQGKSLTRREKSQIEASEIAPKKPKK